MIDIHGSCVSRDCFNREECNEIKVNYYLSRNNIVSTMMPPVDLEFNHGDLRNFTSEYSERCMRLALNKETVPRLLGSDSEFLVVDFYDLCQPVAAYKNSTFSTYDYTFYNAPSFQGIRTKLPYMIYWHYQPVYGMAM